jgi:adenine deaminase
LLSIDLTVAVAVALTAEVRRLDRPLDHRPIDTVDQDLPEQLRYYANHSGDLGQLTVSSDAQTAGATVGMLYESFVACVRDGRLPLERILPLFTRSPATALKLRKKGRIAVGADADLLVMTTDDYALTLVIAKGEVLLRDGERVPSAT